jgi:hypothetical protein
LSSAYASSKISKKQKKDNASCRQLKFIISPIYFLKIFFFLFFELSISNQINSFSLPQNGSNLSSKLLLPLASSSIPNIRKTNPQTFTIFTLPIINHTLLMPTQPNQPSHQQNNPKRQRAQQYDAISITHFNLCLKKFFLLIFKIL